MKRIVLILSVFIGIMACQQEDGPKISNKYQELFKLSGAKKPQWLEKEIASIILRSSIYRPTRILVYRGPEKEIIAIEDSTNSSMEQQLRFFDCAGNKVAFKSAEYNSCIEKWKRREFLLLWTN